MVDEKQRKHYVAPPEGHELTEADALAMGYALFDAIAKEQAEQAREADPPGDDG